MKKNYIVGGVVLLLIAAGLVFWQVKRPGSGLKPEKFNGQGEDVLAPGAGNVPSVSPTPTPTGGTKTGGKLSYGDAIKKYPYRIQFVDCHGNPGSISLKRNLPLMLDNRDPKAHTIKVAGQSYYIKAYDYLLAYIAKEGIYNLTCDGGGSASVNIEK